MKKFSILLAVICIFALMAAGCSGGSDDIQQGLQDIQDDLNDTTSQTTTTPEATQSQAPVATQAPSTSQNTAGTQSQTPAGTQNSEVTDQTIDDLTQRVSEVVTEVENATAPSTYDESWNLFRTIDQKIQDVEEAIDRADDQLEWEYESGTISREEYRQREKLLDDLDDQLGRAEDELEYKLGIDD